MRHLFDSLGFGGTSHGPDPDLSTRLEPDFTHVDESARLSVSIVRTLRVPGDGRSGAVPSGLGRLPMTPVRDLPETPAPWSDDRGVAVPVYQSEAVRLLLGTPTCYPFAVKVLADGMNARTGETWRPGLRTAPRNFLVVPGEHHVDGVPGPDGRPRQLAAVTVDDDDSVGSGMIGRPFDDAVTVRDLQLVVTPLKAGRWRSLRGDPRGVLRSVRTDRFGPDDWDLNHAQTCFVRLVPAQRWEAITGSPVPHPPISRELYTGAGIPWLESFQVDREVPNQGRTLRELDDLGWGKSA